MSQTTENIGLYLEDDANEKFKNWREKMNGPVDSNMVKIDRAIASKQNKLVGAVGQIPVFDENGEIVAKDPEETGVVSFNGRKGLVIPQAGDYSADDILMPDGTSVSTAYSNISGRVTERNLLDNAYWAAKENIVNQRGKLEYTSGYGIDRWDSSNTKVTINNGYIELYRTGGTGIFRQALEIFRFFNGIYTWSILFDNGILVSKTSEYNFASPITTEGISLIDGWVGGIYANQDEMNRGVVIFQVFNYSTSKNLKIKGAKLEPGPVSTLAHKDAAGNWVLNDPPPDYGLELLKCQRYQLILANHEIIPYGAPSIFGRIEYDGMISLFIPTPVELRANPVIKGDNISVVGNHTVVQLPSVNTIGRKDSNGVYFSIPGDFSAIGNMEAVSANVKNLTFDSNL